MLDAQSYLEVFAPTARFAGWMLACAIFLVRQYRRKASVVPTLLTTTALYVLGTAALIEPLDEYVGPGMLLSAATRAGNVIFAAFYLAIPAAVIAVVLTLLVYLLSHLRAKRATAQPTSTRGGVGQHVWVLWVVCIGWSASLDGVTYLAERFRQPVTTPQNGDAPLRMSVTIDVRRSLWRVGSGDGIAGARTWACSDASSLPPSLQPSPAPASRSTPPQEPARNIVFHNRLADRLVVMRLMPDGEKVKQVEVGPHERVVWPDDETPHVYEVQKTDGTCHMRFVGR